MKKNIEIIIIVRDVDTNQSIEGKISKQIIDEVVERTSKFSSGVDVVNELYFFCLRELEKYDGVNDGANEGLNDGVK